MSHFTVLVIGNHIESQLARFDENKEMDIYRVGEVSDEEKERFMNYYLKKAEVPAIEGNEKMTKEELFDALYEEHGCAWNNDGWVKGADGVWEEWSTYNPDSKWDWYQIGGRWKGFFKTHFNSTLLSELGFSINEVKTLANLKDKNLKKFNDAVAKYKGKEDQIKTLVSLYNATKGEENRVDQAKKKNIDFVGMREDARDNALARYDRIVKLFGGAVPKMTVSSEEADEQAKDADGNVDWDKARDIYWAQPALKTLEKVRAKAKTDEDKQLLGWINLNDYQCTRDEYGQRAYNGGVSTYAILKDGEWYAKGEMGWWAMSNDKMTQDEWDVEVTKLIDSCSDETLFTLVDCHI